MTLQANLEAVNQRLRQACESTNRPPGSVQLLAVSKTKPAEQILELANLGHKAFGENYLQEALEKITQLAETPNCPKLEWHFIGPIQSNKTRSIAENFDWVHSIERLKIAERLSLQRPHNLPPLNCLIQLNTSNEDSKSGISPAEVVDLAEKITRLPNLRLRGLMTIPSPTIDTDALAQEFELCRNSLLQLQQHGIKADTLSMGMSADLETAIAHGSTCIRIGTALFGSRT